MHTQFQLVGIQLITPAFFFSVCKFLECFFDYNMHTYAWLVFALNILFSLVWKNLPHLMLPPLPNTHITVRDWMQYTTAF